MRVTDRDLEILSNYLDGQLDNRDRARLETRLQKDPDLREAHEQLNRTRLVLRSLPKMRAPRNYTLSPRTVPARTALPRSYPVLRLVTALASFLLIFTLLGDYLVFRPGEMVSRTAEQALEAPAAVMEAPLMATQALSEMQALEAPAAAETESPPPSDMLEMAPEAPREGSEDLEQAKQIPSIQGEARASVTVEEPTSSRLFDQGAYLRVVEVSLAAIAILAGVLAVYQRRRLRLLYPPK
jgi:hypothetical protein